MILTAALLLVAAQTDATPAPKAADATPAPSTASPTPATPATEPTPILGVVPAPKKSDADAAFDKPGFATRWLETAKLSGFSRMDVGYTFPLKDEQLVGGNGGFRLADFRMALDFSPAERLSVSTSVELSYQQLDPTDPLSGRRSINLMDAFLEYRACKGALVRMGQFRPGYDAEMLMDDGALPFISRSILANGLMPPEGYYVAPLAPDRQIGLQVASERLGGETLTVRYLAGVFNGNGLNQLFNDNNAVAPYGRVEIALWEKVILGLNASYNTIAQGTRPNRLYTNQLGYGADLMAKFGQVDVLAAFLGRNSSFSYAGLTAESAMGVLGQVRWASGTGWEAAVRGAWYEPSSAQTDDRITELAAMVGYHPPKLPFRILVQYTDRQEEAKVAYPNDSVDVMLHATW